MPIKIVPKGLRSFDSHDADFFLELLPGPRDRHGLPDGLRFWKTRVEEMDPDNTFSVGLIYGQSGCGKSSFIKAALLPRLSDDVAAIYIEATPDETETRLLRGLRKRCPSLPDNLNLKDSLTSLRRGLGVPHGKKVLIVIDQFEQWLHSCNEEDSELVQALRQCDGGRVQCLVMVRDDFWMAATRFMRELELRLLEGQNSAAVDLFPIRHATRVLAAFGRAFGTISDDYSRITADQKEFLRQSAEGLAEDGKVVCVRLALFAEMMKGKTWNVDTLRQVGGTKGVGAAFLDENFSTSSAPPEHRYHEQAARKVLNALLPDSGANIKGAMKSYDELLDVSGYRRRPREFDDLLTILDSELRLLTPTDPEGRQDDDESSRDLADERYYQLTHDYLVHSLRDWLTRKQKETRRGRAELLLQDRAAVWSTKPENRYLPSLSEYCNICARTDRRNRNAAQNEMMSRARRHHGLRIFSIVTVLALMTAGIYHLVRQERERNSLLMVQASVDALQNSSGPVVRYAIDDLREFPKSMVVAELRRRIDKSSGRRLLTLAYALSSFDTFTSKLLVQEIPGAPGEECSNITSALATDAPHAIAALSEAFAAANKSHQWRLKARLAIVLLALKESAGAGDMLRIDRPDPGQRAIFIDEFARWHSNLAELAEFLRESSVAPLISGVCLAIGQIPRDNLSEIELEKWEPVLATWYRDHRNAAIHNSAGLALQRWSIDLPAITAATSAVREPFTWHITRMGLTLIRLPAGNIDIEVTDGTSTTRVIVVDSDFYICDREVSVELFRKFIDDPSYNGEKPTDWGGEKTSLSPTGIHPVQQVSWNEAAMFCNWLSFREGLERCYKLTEETGKWQSIPDTDGYRLPNVAECEYACRAGTRTRFACGDTAEFLEDYAVYGKEEFTKPGGSKLCNAWGIFDMHGNVWEWVNDCPTDPAATNLRCLHGGSRGVPASQVQSGSRTHHGPKHRSSALGFRVVRNAGDN